MLCIRCFCLQYQFYVECCVVRPSKRRGPLQNFFIHSLSVLSVGECAGGWSNQFWHERSFGSGGTESHHHCHRCWPSASWRVFFPRPLECGFFRTTQHPYAWESARLLGQLPFLPRFQCLCWSPLVRTWDCLSNACVGHPWCVCLAGVLSKKDVWVSCGQACGQHDQPIVSGIASGWCWCWMRLLFGVLLCRALCPATEHWAVFADMWCGNGLASCIHVVKGH